MVCDDFRKHLAAAEAGYTILENENVALRACLESFLKDPLGNSMREDARPGDRSPEREGIAQQNRLKSNDFLAGCALTDIEFPMPTRTFSQDGAHGTQPRQTAPEESENKGLSSFRPTKMARFSSSRILCPDPAVEEESAAVRKGVFPNVDDMKMNVRQNLVEKQYDVTDYYKQGGCLAQTAKHPVFEILTLIVIGFNAIWIAVDTDHNKAQTLVEADALFQIVENAFCVYFFCEICIRFGAFEYKCNCLRDYWFLFDAVLVTVMVLETWILGIVMSVVSTSGSSSGLGNASVMRLARLLRLTRMARMARLLRAVPELVILVKGMASAARSVLFTLLLLLILLYVFAIAFTQLLEDTDVGKEYFSNVAQSMHTLWLFATLIDEISTLVMIIQLESYPGVVLMDLFILAASLTVMNMLIGVLCEVVSAVAASEREELSLQVVKSKVENIFFSMGLDEDNNGMISKEEFRKIMENRDAARAINDLGVDVIQLVDMADFFFAQDFEDQEYRKEFSFAEFMDMVVQLRGTNTATVKDIMLLRKFISVELQSIEKSRSFGMSRASSFHTSNNEKSSMSLPGGKTNGSLAIGGMEEQHQHVIGVQKPVASPSLNSPGPPDIPPPSLPMTRPSSATLRTRHIADGGFYSSDNIPGAALQENKQLCANPNLISGEFN